MSFVWYLVVRFYITVLCVRPSAYFANVLANKHIIAELSVGQIDPLVGSGRVGSMKLDPWPTLYLLRFVFSPLLCSAAIEICSKLWRVILLQRNSTALVQIASPTASAWRHQRALVAKILITNTDVATVRRVSRATALCRFTFALTLVSEQSRSCYSTVWTKRYYFWFGLSYASVYNDKTTCICCNLLIYHQTQTHTHTHTVHALRRTLCTRNSTSLSNLCLGPLDWLESRITCRFLLKVVYIASSVALWSNKERR